MRRDVASPPAVRQRVIHFAGRVTEEVFSFLGPATSALTEAGIAQVVVMMDDERDRHLQTRFHPDVDLILTEAGSGPLKRWRRSLINFREALLAEGQHEVHLHGFLPCLLGVLAARAAGLHPPMHYSPHGSKSLVSLASLHALLLKALAPRAGHAASSIVGLPAEARTLGKMTQQSVDLVEHTVDAAFFSAQRHETRYPLIVTGGTSQEPAAARHFEQIAVLLGGEALRISFNWIGTADAVWAQRLKAANVGVTDVLGAEHRASRLAASWVYVAPAGGRGFPLYLAEAMCVGLPCVAADTAAHRDVLRDGETGFLCADPQQMLARIGELLDDVALRRRLGEAARATAFERFGEARFRSSLLLAYKV